MIGNGKLNHYNKLALAQAAVENIILLYKILSESEEVRTMTANHFHEQSEENPAGSIALLEAVKTQLDDVIETLDLKIGT